MTAGVSGCREFAQHIKSGKMRALAVSSPKAIEGIPSLKEQGVDVELANWRGIFGAPGINAQQRDELVKLVRGAPRSRRGREAAEKHDWDDFFLAGDAYGKYVDEENKRLGEILGALGLGKK